MTANPFLLPDDPMAQAGPTLAKLHALQAAKSQATAPTPLPAPSSDASVDALINRYSQLYGVNPRIAKAQMMAESSGDPNARSKAGAIGYFQLMPSTAQALGVDPYNPQQNIEGGIRYLAQNLKRFGGDYRKALAAYNAGPGAVEQYGGVPPYAETQAYVQKILGGAKDAVGSFLSSLTQPIMGQADAAEVPRETNPFLVASEGKPLGDTSNPFLQQVATETALQPSAAAQWSQPGTVAKQMGMDLLGALSHAAGTVKHLAGDVIGGIGNLEESLGPARVIREAIAGQPVHYAPTFQGADTDLTAQGLAHLQQMAQQHQIGGGLFPELDALFSHAALAPSQPQVVQNPDLQNKVAMAALAQGQPLTTDASALLNVLKRATFEAATDPVTFAGGAIAHGLGWLKDAIMGTKAASALADASQPLRAAIANSAPIQKTLDVIGTNAPTKRTYGADINGVMDALENRHAQLNDLEAARHQALLDANRTDILNAENAGIVNNAKPVLPFPIQQELDRDSWLLGTQRVRNIMQQQGFVPTADIKDAPLLNVLEGYQQGYVPMKEVAADPGEFDNLYNAAAGLRKNAPLSFTLRADENELAQSPLIDRLAYRLQQGRDVRQMLNTRRDILNNIGALEKPPGVAMLKAQRANLPAPGTDPASDVIRENLNNEIAKVEAMQNVHESALRGSTLRPEDDLVPFSDRYLGYFDPQTFDTSGLTNLTHDQIAMYHNMAAKEARTFMVPASIAKRLQGENAPLNIPFLRGWADLKRAALFTLPFGHMKNIGSLQLEGPGGMTALLAGMRMGDDAAKARLPELAEMGAAGMGVNHELPQFSIGNWNPYESPVLKDAWQQSQGSLGLFDAKQRLALHDSLMANNPEYAIMDPLQRGAKLNDVLFDYGHSSQLAKAMRGVGAPFPSWRLGNVALQARRLADSPGRVIGYGKAQQIAQNALNGDPNDPQGYGWRFNTPLEEAMKAPTDAALAGLAQIPGNQWLMTTLGQGGAAYSGDIQDQTQAPAMAKFLEGFAGDTIPGAQYLEALAGASPFYSRAPGWAQAAGDVFGISSKSHLSPKQRAIEEIMANNPFIQRPQAQLLTRSHGRHARSL